MQEILLDDTPCYQIVMLYSFLFGFLYYGIRLVIRAVKIFRRNSFKASDLSWSMKGVFIVITTGFILFFILNSKGFRRIQFNREVLVLYPNTLRSPIYLTWRNVGSIHLTETPHKRHGIRSHNYSICITDSVGKKHKSVLFAQVEKERLESIVSELRNLHGRNLERSSSD